MLSTTRCNNQIATQLPYPLLSPKISKLGTLIYGFSIPAVVTCPGRTAACMSVCYANTSFFVMASVRSAHQRNLEATKRDTFVKRMVREITRLKMSAVRIHVAGDFNTAEYIDKWRTIAESCPGVVFYAYTRSWRIKELRPGLKDLAALPNVHLWLSLDSDTGVPRPIANTRQAYLQRYGEDDSAIPSSVNLVFRDNRNKVQKRINGTLVCPAENGVDYKLKMTCSRCKLCWKGDNAEILQRTDSQDRVEHATVGA